MIKILMFNALFTLLSGLLSGISQFSLNQTNRQQALQDREYNNPANQVKRLVAAGINPNSAVGSISNTFSMPAQTANGSTIGSEIANSLADAATNIYSRKRQKEIDNFNQEMRKADLELKRQELAERKQNYEINRLLIGERFLAQSFTNSFNNQTFFNKVKQSLLDTRIKEAIFNKNQILNSLYPDYYASIIDKNLSQSSKLKYDIFNQNRLYNYRKEYDKANFKLRSQSMFNQQSNFNKNFNHKLEQWDITKKRIEKAIQDGDYRNAQYWFDFATDIFSDVATSAVDLALTSKLRGFKASQPKVQPRVQPRLRIDHRNY